MARGRFSDTFQISTNADTAIIPAPSTTSVGAPERIYVLFIGVSVSVAGTTSRVRIENGVGGDVIFRMSTVTADAMASRDFGADRRKGTAGYQLDQSTALNVNTSGGAAATIDVTVVWEVR